MSSIYLDCFSRAGRHLDDPHVPACNKYFFLSRTYLKLAFEFVFKGRVSLGQPTRPRV